LVPILAGACDSYIAYITVIALRSLRALRWMETPL